MKSGAPHGRGPDSVDDLSASARPVDGRRAGAAVLSVVAVFSIILASLLATGAAASGTPSTAAFVSPTTTVPPTTTTTAPPPPTTTTTVPPSPPTTAPPPPPTTTVPPTPPAPATAPAPAPGWGCGPALAYLAAHSAPGFTTSCPGPADGHQAETTAYFANGQVTGTISIADPCPAAYMNEAHNSWVLRAKYLGTAIPDGLGPVIDPYGYCQ